MLLERITFTGVDSKTDLARAIEIAKASPTPIEYGILVSESGAGLKPRYPSIEEARAIITTLREAGLPVALHVCGRWSRELLKGEARLFKAFPPDLGYKRLQWNINPPGRTEAKRAKWNVAGTSEVLWKHFFGMIEGARLIMQRHSESSVMLYEALRENHIPVPADILFDASGGRGEVNTTWPEPIGNFCGYAGGFSPENVEERVCDLGASLPEDQLIWIDMESGVRTEDIFDLDKVESVARSVERVVPE